MLSVRRSLCSPCGAAAALRRGAALSARQREFVLAATALGAGNARLMLVHILPNVAGLILANTTLTVPVAILSETTLAFLGLGDPTNASWGKILEEAFNQGALTEQAWWYYIPPGVGINDTYVGYVVSDD